MTSLQVNALDTVTPELALAISMLTRRQGLHRLMGGRVQNCVRDHLIHASRTRHATARRLGAKPTGFLGQAAEKVARKQSLTADDSQAAISLNHPGLIRAFKDVEIRPGPGKKALTIPMIAQAYGQRAYRIWDKEGLFVISTEKGAFAVKKNADDSLTAYYKLAPSVNQKQDRTLLPSDAELEQAALAGARDYFSLLRSRRGGAA